MAQLSPNDRERCYTHLGYGSIDGIPHGDLIRFEDGLVKIRSNYQVNVLVAILDSCDRWFNLWLLPPQEMVEAVTSKELIQGDLNRSVLRTGSPMEVRDMVWNNYLARVAELAHQLWVPNYREEINDQRYRFERAGGDFINSVPGPADTAVGAAQFEYIRNGGGVGIPVF